jgi:hypothetical protein
MTLLKRINKTSLLLPYEQLYIQSNHQHKQLISEQYIGDHNLIYELIHKTFSTSLPTRPTNHFPTISTTKPVPSWPCYQTGKITRYVNKKTFYISRTCCIFWNIFTILSFLHNIEFYLQHVLQCNYNVHIYTLVILPIFKISVWQIPIAVNTVLRLLMMGSKSVSNV